MAELWSNFWWVVVLAVLVLPGLRWLRRSNSDKDAS